MPLYQWSTTPGNNASAGLINWAEGQAPSTVNDSARQMMADVATWFVSPEWLNYGLTPTYVNATQFTLSGDQTSIYSVARRVRAFITGGPIYGTISASTYTSLTTVSVTWDSGSLNSGLAEVDVGILNPTNAAFPSIFKNGINIGNSSLVTELDQFFIVNGTTMKFYLNPSNGEFGLFDTTRSLDRWWSSASGDFTVAGNISANSDERLKTDWQSLQDNFVDKLATVRNGTYTRTDTDARHVGVGAQSLQEVLPEAVLESEKGVLSVAYGQAALAACVELAKEIVRLRALLEPVK